jgi:hypothetical protein
VFTVLSKVRVPEATDERAFDAWEESRASVPVAVTELSAPIAISEARIFFSRQVEEVGPAEA